MEQYLALFNGTDRLVVNAREVLRTGIITSYLSLRRLPLNYRSARRSRRKFRIASCVAPPTSAGNGESAHPLR